MWTWRMTSVGAVRADDSRYAVVGGRQSTTPVAESGARNPFRIALVLFFLSCC